MSAQRRRVTLGDEDKHGEDQFFGFVNSVWTKAVSAAVEDV